MKQKLLTAAASFALNTSMNSQAKTFLLTMKRLKQILIILFIVLSHVCMVNGQTNNYFNLTFVKTFVNGQSSQVAYINFPDVNLWGTIEVTITGGFNNQPNVGKLTKSFSFIYNSPGGYFSQNNEVATAFGDLANQWNLGDYDNINHRIPIYHLVPTGNVITIRVEGLLQHTSSVSSIISNLTVSDPAVVSNSIQRQYRSFMESRIGVGTNSPTEMFEVGNGGNISLMANSGDPGDIVFKKSDGAQMARIYSSSNGTNCLFLTTQTNNTANLFIDQAGRIGIGTTAPLNRLDIGGATVIGSAYSGVNSAPTDGLLVQGNVLIGKTSQTNTAYKLDVSGKVRADEITVNTTGADFVFEPKYKLLTLVEVEAFIKANKHLPDIAPATDMQTNGVSMGEMQAKLLQKVEELTLYTIEQSKQLQEQRQTNTVLEKKFAEQDKIKVEQDKKNADLQQQLAAQAKEIEQLKLLITQKLK